MYQNYIFDLYGTLVDIHTNEKKAYLWKKMSLFFGMKGAAYEPKELRMAYETKIKEQEAALKMECRGSHVPEIDIADVFRQLFEDQAVSVTEEEIADLAKMFRAISIEELKLFPGVPEMLQRLKDAGKKVFLLSNAQALFTAPEISLLGLTRYFDGILLSSDAGVKKPDPAFYEMLLKQYHLDPAECLMTEMTISLTATVQPLPESQAVTWQRASHRKSMVRCRKTVRRSRRLRSCSD